MQNNCKRHTIFLLILLYSLSGKNHMQTTYISKMTLTLIFNALPTCNHDNELDSFEIFIMTIFNRIFFFCRKKCCKNSFWVGITGYLQQSYRQNHAIWIRCIPILPFYITKFTVYFLGNQKFPHFWWTLWQLFVTFGNCS